MLGKRKEAGLAGPTSKLREAGRERGLLPGFGGRKGDQPCEISGGLTIGQFPRREIRNITVERPVWGC